MRSIFLISSLIFICSCTSSLSDLKKSSSNQLFDATGFHANKRRPLYNAKYINKAKENIVNSDFEIEDDQEDELEIVNPSRKNISMYKGMIDSDSSDDYLDDEGDDIVTARRRLDSRDNTKSRRDLEKEISEIKDLLKKTKDEVSKSKCPYDSDSKTTRVSSIAKEKELEDPELNKEIDAELKAVASLKTDKTLPKKALVKKALPDAKPGSMSHIKN